MVSELTKDVVSWLNQFPSKSCVVRNAGPQTLMTGQQFDYKIHCRVEFGQYCQVHEDKQAKNRVDLQRITDRIALRSSGNLQGGYRFLNLNTSRIISRHHFTVVPIPQQVNDRVHKLATKENQPKGLEVYDGLGKFLPGEPTANSNAIAPDEDHEENHAEDDYSIGELFDDDDVNPRDDEHDSSNPTEITGVLPEDEDEIDITGVHNTNSKIIDLTGPENEEENEDDPYTPLPLSPPGIKLKEGTVVFEEEAPNPKLEEGKLF